VGLLQRPHGVLGVREGPGLDEGDGREGGQVAEEADLFTGERRAVRLAANSTPTNSDSTMRGVPQMATIPSSPTAPSIGRVCWNRASEK